MFDTVGAIYFFAKIILFWCVIFLIMSVLMMYFEMRNAKNFRTFSIIGIIIPIVIAGVPDSALVLVGFYIWVWVGLVLSVIICKNFLEDKNYLNWKKNFHKKKRLFMTLFILIAYLLYLQYRYAFAISGLFQIKHPSLFRDAIAMVFFQF